VPELFEKLQLQLLMNHDSKRPLLYDRVCRHANTATEKKEKSQMTKNSMAGCRVVAFCILALISMTSACSEGDGSPSSARNGFTEYDFVSDSSIRVQPSNVGITFLEPHDATLTRVPDTLTLGMDKIPLSIPEDRPFTYSMSPHDTTIASVIMVDATGKEIFRINARNHSVSVFLRAGEYDLILTSVYSVQEAGGADHKLVFLHSDSDRAFSTDSSAIYRLFSTNSCSGENLCGANLAGVNLDSAYLEGADLNGVNLSNANLCNATLCNSVLDGANLKDAMLLVANLGGATGVTNAYLLTHCDLYDTIMPDGSNAFSVVYSEPAAEGLGASPYNTDYGKPNKIDVKSVSDDEKDITFGVITDTHINASYAGWVPSKEHKYRDTHRVIRNRRTIDDINMDAAGCLGIVHLGDMVDKNTVQNLVAFRQLYENDYPGGDRGAIRGAGDADDHAYSQGYRIEKPIFVSLGNCPHDTQSTPDGWHYARDYVADRIKDAPGILSYYSDDAYIWRWGQYILVHFGLWAGDPGYSSNKFIDYDKLQWIKDWLADNRVYEEGLGVLIFQHYGWDGFSTDGRWWSPEMRALELDILCRRDAAVDPDMPYNVLAICTGHIHAWNHFIVYAGKDALGEDVLFDNISFEDAGSAGDPYGYSIMSLTGDKMIIRSRNVADPDPDHCWRSWEKKIIVPNPRSTAEKCARTAAPD